MTTTASPLLYPLVNGFKHSFASIEANFAGFIILGFKSITYSRTRNRAMVYGTNSDPLGKTRAFNEYQAECEMYLAEFNYLMAQLQAAAQNGTATSPAVPGAGASNGYGDVSFIVKVTYSENGSDLIQDVLLGCTLDTTDVSNSQSPDALVRKFKLNPIKIQFNGTDDSAQPLVAPPTT